MGAIFRYQLRRYRGMVLGWGLAVFLIAVLVVVRYDFILGARKEFEALLDSSIGQMLKLFGDPRKMLTPEGFLSFQLFTFLPLILGVYAVLAGSGLVAADEENGTLDLVLAHPVSRTELFLGRLAAFVLATVLILTAGWLGLKAGMLRSSMDVPGGRLALPFLSLLAVLLVLGTLALLLSLVMSSRRLAAATAGLVLAASFFLTLLSRDDPGLRTFARFLPLYYYQSGEAIEGLDLASFGGLLAAAGLFAALAWWVFQRRDVRVSGEGGWRWPRIRRRHVPSSTGREETHTSPKR